MGKSIDNLITFLESHKNADNAHHMAVYMKNQFPFCGMNGNFSMSPATQEKNTKGYGLLIRFPFYSN